MKISTKGRYALRLMLDLALHEQSGYVPIKVIAERQDISDKYLEQIISILARAGFVKSVRGAGGGYKLAKTPAEYTVGMILRLTEGSLAPVACLTVWKKLYGAINGVVDGITLQDLVNQENARIDDYVI